MKYQGVFAVLVTQQHNNHTCGGVRVDVGGIDFTTHGLFAEGKVDTRKELVLDGNPERITASLSNGSRVVIRSPGVKWDYDPDTLDTEKPEGGVLFEGWGEYEGTYKDLFNRRWCEGVLVFYDKYEFVAGHLLMSAVFSFGDPVAERKTYESVCDTLLALLDVWERLVEDNDDLVEKSVQQVIRIVEEYSTERGGRRVDKWDSAITIMKKISAIYVNMKAIAGQLSHNQQ